jgi:hypothetical protein
MKDLKPRRSTWPGVTAFEPPAFGAADTPGLLSCRAGTTTELNRRSSPIGIRHAQSLGRSCLRSSARLASEASWEDSPQWFD